MQLILNISIPVRCALIGKENIFKYIIKYMLLALMYFRVTGNFSGTARSFNLLLEKIHRLKCQNAWFFLSIQCELLQVVSVLICEMPVWGRLGTRFSGNPLTVYFKVTLAKRGTCAQI